jgi:hypothetical protein
VLQKAAGICTAAAAAAAMVEKQALDCSCQVRYLIRGKDLHTALALSPPPAGRDRAATNLMQQKASRQNLAAISGDGRYTKP